MTTQSTATNTQAEELNIANCPFCGSDQGMLRHHDHYSGHMIMCNECTAEGPLSDDENIAIEAWNRRAAAPSVSLPEAPLDAETLWKIHGALNEAGKLSLARQVADAAALAQQPVQAGEDVAAEMKRLHDALCFWLPQSHAGLPDAVQERIAADAYLLVGYDDMPDKQSAEELGWISAAPAPAAAGGEEALKLLVGYAREAELAKLADDRVAGVGMMIHKDSGEGKVALYRAAATNTEKKNG